MKHILIASALALALVLAMGSASLALPMQSGAAGQFSLFGNYNNDEGFAAGAGYALTNGLTVGGEYYPDYNEPGVFAILNHDPFILKGEIAYDPSWPGMFGYGRALYAIDMYPLTLGLGGGAYFEKSGSYSETDFYLEAAANIDAGGLSLYGNFDYYPAYADYNFEAGVSIGL